MKKIGIGLFFIISAASFGKITPGNSLISTRGNVSYISNSGEFKKINSKRMGINIRVAMGMQLEMTSGISYGAAGVNKTISGFYIKVTNIGNVEDIYEVYLIKNDDKKLIDDTGLLKPGEYKEIYVGSEGLGDTIENYEVQGISLRNPFVTKSLRGTYTFPSLYYDQGIEEPINKRKFYVFNIERQDTSVKFDEEISKVKLIKYQGLGYKGNLDMNIDYTTKDLEANSGDRIFYKLALINDEESYIRDVSIKDTIPNNTKMSYGDYSISPKGVPCYRIINKQNFSKIPVVPLEGTQGDISITIPKVDSKDILEVYFNVKID